ncbi:MULTISPECIES: BamA/OMP85 family outer membrane protein [Fusobacterium]|jgi:outer membrane protein insertion porin family|uniref:Outer membrane protein assembly factor n=1 Tax=Fusobacterium varium ATCC 27725 TaxID=469618 RepID=A0ABM6U099_FUSVA|nr:MULTISPECIES: outer membrane protein assembly factor [Fusobacterium]AVQ29688.1 outer membrane protein assembly factor [Fusobacterium varium ATCC 27725]EES64466.1 outer membrane protein, OMP85 family [Fusobacterium varium ATCC 27725]MCD7979593.1 outer membrane protein assembly factor [Fusobacterium sp.]MCF0169933.1 outer membrane protein assembly factor [Fusobacterium varium]MCF2672871.1 outer membrane protein assembly factor [Fusobacterium varium]
MRKQLIVLMIFLLGLFSFGAESNYSIKKVEVINNREIPFEIILENMKSKEGEKFVTDNMIEDYKSIKGLEYVNDVSIQPTVYDGGIKLTVDITENRDAKSMLEKKGIIPLSERGKVDTSLLVNSVEFIGNHYVSTKELMEKVPVKVGSYFSKNKVIEGHKNLIESGYFRDVIPDAVKSGKGVKVIYEVMENPILNGVNIIGNTVYTTEDLMKVIKTEPGKIFNINTIREDRDRILKKYQDDGYTLTDVTDIGINGNLELEIYLSEGTVRDIQFKKMVTKQKGARRKPTDDVLKTKTYVIERELEFSKDEIFNSKKYDETVKNLMRLGHFKNVKYESRDIPGDPDGKTIVLLLDEERTAILQGAISYGSEIGLLGTISIKDTNWKGKGQELGFTFEKSDEDYTSFSINFYDPWIKDTDRISWGWSLYKNSYEDDDSKLFHKIDTIGAKFNIGKGLTKNVRLSLGTKFEYVEERAQKGKFYENGGKYYWSNGGPEVRGIDDDYFIWSLFPSLTYDTRNHFWNPTAGEYAKLQLEGGYAGGYDGDVFGNVTLELRKYHRGFFKNNTFAYKVVGGIMTDSTKEAQRFWVGGGSTLRGYDGGFFKGTQKLVGTIENRTQINELLGFVVFFDAGRAWKQNGRDLEYGQDADFPDKVATTAGVGLRLNTPIGPLRFDFGWPVGDKMDSGMEFYFNMGQSF